MFRAASVLVALVLASVLVVSVAAQPKAPAKKAPAAAGPKRDPKVPPASPNVPAEPAGMVSMFNGKDLSEWDGDPRLWSVKDGVIRGETTKEVAAKGNTFLIWKGGELADFELRLQYRVSTSNNSGVQYRSRHVPPKETDANKWVVGGYQAEVRNEPGQAGFIYDEKGKRGRMCLVSEKVVWKDKKEKVGDVGDFSAIANSFKVDDWNEYTIICKGSNIKQYLNGVQTVDFTDESDSAYKKGIIALQIHAGAPMWVEFRSLRVKKLD